MKCIGFWKEFTKNANDPSIFSEKFDLGLPNSDIVGYLDYAPNLIAYRGNAAECPLRKGVMLDVNSFRTDGEFIWSDALLNYYFEMNIVLPNDFVEHMKSLSYFPVFNILEEKRQEGIQIVRNHLNL